MHLKTLVTIILLATICIDQSSKLIARKKLEHLAEISFCGDIFRFSLVFNHHGFLGFLKNAPQQVQYHFLVIGVATFLGILTLWLYLNKKEDYYYSIPLSLVVGGGISNLIDRLANDGGVTDFLIIGLGSLRTGIFNMADTFILTGSCLLGYLFVNRNIDEQIE